MRAMLSLYMMRNRAGTHNQTGATGELIVRSWLKNKGFLIVADNYQKPWGEIDIIAAAENVIHFVEVKTVSYDSKAFLRAAVQKGGWRPEEQVHVKKMQKIQRTIESWLLENQYEGKWQIDVAAVRLVPQERYATVKFIDNVIFE